MDFIKISYTGRIKDGEVFDTTDQALAETEGLYDKNRVYTPLSVVVGAGQVVKGLEKALEGMKVGQKKSVEVSPEQGYGPRNAELTRLVPMKVFKKQKITPIPGMPIEIDGTRGRVQTVAGGRVRVDFNHELAGKDLVFEVKCESKASSDKDKTEFILDRSFGQAEGFDVKLTGKKLKITIPQMIRSDRNLLIRKASFTADCFKHLKLSEVTFEEVWENPEAKKKKE
ncbi:peptidylprolyl isomerase [Candidatus Altiarchaeota archaeon]